MGNSQTISQSVKLEQISKRTVDEYNLNKNRAEINQTQILSQDATLSGIDNCTFDFSQIANQSAEVDMTLDVDAMFERKDQVKEEFQTAAAGEIDSKFESWGTTWGTKSAVKSDVSTIIEDIVDETWTSENIQETSTNQVQIVDGKYEINGMSCYEGQPTQNFSQNATQELVVNQLMNQMVQKASENEKIKTLTTTSDAKNTLDVKGTLGDAGRAVSSVVGSIGAIVGGPLMSSVIFAGIALIVALGVFMMLGQSPAGQNAIRTASGGMGPTKF